jgi:hypothetical protein
MEVSGQIHAPATFPPVPIGGEAGWAPEPVWTLWRRENFCTAGNRTRAVQPVAIPTELSQPLIIMFKILNFEFIIFNSIVSTLQPSELNGIFNLVKTFFLILSLEN